LVAVVDLGSAFIRLGRVDREESNVKGRSVRLLAIVMAICLLVSMSAQGAATLSIVGSDTMSRLVTAWADAFRTVRPDITIEIQVSGSAAAPPALTEQVANFGVMSRPFSETELMDFLRRRGFLPQGFIVARDSLAVIANHQNPTDSISLEDLDRIFSIGRLCSGRSAVTTWRELGVEHGIAESGAPLILGRINPLGRTAVSGSYGFFKGNVLCGGDFHSRVVELPGFAAIIRTVEADPNAIGYVGSSFIESSVKVLAVHESKKDVATGMSGESARRDLSPLTRDLYLYLTLPPGEQPSVSECAFLKFVASGQAQDILTKSGFLRGDDSLSEGLKVSCG
jgi:phosphate transport system substrate-binding protein